MQLSVLQIRGHKKSAIVSLTLQVITGIYRFMTAFQHLHRHPLSGAACVRSLSLSLSPFRPEKRSDFDRRKLMLSLNIEETDRLKRTCCLSTTPPIGKKAPRFIMSGFGTFPTFNLKRVFHCHENLKEIMAGESIAYCSCMCTRRGI